MNLEEGLKLIEIVFAGSFLLLAYTYFGYPVLIAVLARLRPRPIARGPVSLRVTVIVIAYNEAARIGRKIETCLGLDFPKGRFRVMVVSDGSSDGTDDIVASYADRGVTLLKFSTRRGKAACLNDAVAASEGEIIVFTDARQRLDALAARYLVENFADPSIGAVSGELEFHTEDTSDFGDGVDSYWRYEKFIRQQESRLHSVVGVTGALYALRRDSYREIPVDTILDDVLIPMNVVLTGKRVVFEKRAKAFDLPSLDYRQEKLRKVRTIAGNYQLLVAHPRFLLPWRNPILFQLISHKVLRLAGPLLMAMLLLTNILLISRGYVYLYLLAAQAAGYALPAIGAVWPAASRWRPVKVANAFLLLNWFAVLGAVEFLRNRNAHLWESKHRVRSGG